MYQPSLALGFTPPVTTIHQATAFIDGLGMFRMALGLDQTKAILETLGNPQNKRPVILVAGTNGKGTTSAILTRILNVAGYKTGTYISPHLTNIRERILLNGQWISESDFISAVEQLKSHLVKINWPEDNTPTYFEFMTILAYQYFAQQQVDIAIMEVGLGGRLDATNVVKKPLLSVITSIGMDHMDRLGDTLAKIAAEKAGIIHNNTPVVISDAIPDEALCVIKQKAAQEQAPLLEAKVNRLSRNQSNTHHKTITDTKTQNHYAVWPVSQSFLVNASTALSAVQALQQKGFNVAQSAIDEGISSVQWSGRFEYSAEKKMLLDGCHNEDGFIQLAASLNQSFPNQPLVLLLALRNNRPVRLLNQFLGVLPQVKTIVLTVPPGQEHLYHQPEILSQQLSISNTPQPDFEMAWHEFMDNLSSMTNTVGSDALGVVCGSLYLLGPVRKKLGLS